MELHSECTCYMQYNTLPYFSGPVISLCPEEPASELAPDGEDTTATAVYQWSADSRTGFSNSILRIYMYMYIYMYMCMYYSYMHCMDVIVFALYTRISCTWILTKLHIYLHINLSS